MVIWHCQDTHWIMLVIDRVLTKMQWFNYPMVRREPCRAIGAFIFPTINHRSQAGSYELSGTQPYDNLKQFNQFKQPKSGAWHGEKHGLTWFHFSIRSGGSTITDGVSPSNKKRLVWPHYPAKRTRHFKLVGYIILEMCISRCTVLYVIHLG